LEIDWIDDSPARASNLRNLASVCPVLVLARVSALASDMTPSPHQRLKIDVTSIGGNEGLAGELIQWVKSAAEAGGNFLLWSLSGAPLRIQIIPVDGSGIRTGNVWIRGRLDQDRVGRRRRQLSCQRLMLTHEMCTCRSRRCPMNTIGSKRAIAVSRGADRTHPGEANECGANVGDLVRDMRRPPQTDDKV